MNQLSRSLQDWYCNAPLDKHGHYAHACSQIGTCLRRKSPALLLGNLGLEDLPPDVWKMTWLTQLHIGGNALSHIPQEIGQLVSLSHLLAGGNHIRLVDDNIKQLQKLEVLDLSANDLSRPPRDLHVLRSLRYLYLQGNPMQELPGNISQFPQGCTIMTSALPTAALAQMSHYDADCFTFPGRSDGPVVFIDRRCPMLWLPHPRLMA
jgi:hypothetical protein